MFKKILIFIALCLFLTLLLLLCLCLSLLAEMPLYVGVLLWGGVIALGVVFRYLWVLAPQLRHLPALKRWTQRNALSRVESIMLEHLKRGRKRLRRSRSSKTYPWFLVTGVRSGKSSLLASASYVYNAELNGNQHIIPTRSLRWWFFSNVAFLEVGSPFLQKTPLFNRAWKRLATGIKRLPPPSGIVFCLDFSTLKAEGEGVAENQARLVRQRCDAIMKSSGRRLPVYLIITGCDAEAGFVYWSQKLSREQQQHPLGYLWTQPPLVDRDTKEWFKPVFDTVVEGLSFARISMLNGAIPDRDVIQYLDFPERFGRLQSATERCMTILCEPGRHAEYLLAGGVFFTGSVEKENAKPVTPFFCRVLLGDILPHHIQGREIETVTRHRSLRRSGAVITSILLCLSVLYSLTKVLPFLPRHLQELSASEQTRLIIDIESHAQEWQSLPFRSLLNIRKAQIESAIAEKLQVESVSPDMSLMHLRVQYLQGNAQVKRDILVGLSGTILTLQHLQAQRPLTELLQEPEVSPEFNFTGLSDDADRATTLIAQRHLMSTPTGQHLLLTLRNQLRTLVKETQNYQWLMAPVAQLHPVELNTVSPFFSEGPELNGIWTREGMSLMENWIVDLRQAGCQDLLPPFSEIAALINTTRQEVWIRWIMAVNRLPLRVLNTEQWQALLLDIDNMNSPAMRLSRTIEEQLDDISWSEATPWLRTLRQMNALQGTKTLDPLIKHSGLLEQGLKRKFLPNATKITGQPVKTMKKTIPPGHAWEAWRTGVRNTVANALEMPSYRNGSSQHIFETGPGNKDAPLLQLPTLFIALRNSFPDSLAGYDTRALWSLWQLDQKMLVSQAVQYTSCGLQEQWQLQVLWPLEKNNQQRDISAQDALIREYLTAFIRGPAKGMVVPSSGKLIAARFDEQPVPLRSEFLTLLSRYVNPDDLLPVPVRDATKGNEEAIMLKEAQLALEEQRKAQEETPVQVDLISTPASVAVGAKLMPTGTRLTLVCDGKKTVLESMNFSEQGTFSWRPAHCPEVTLDILFPDFRLRKVYAGQNAFPAFLADFSTGTQTFPSTLFAKHTSTLQQLNIKEIVVGYQTENADQIQQNVLAWDTLNLAIAENDALQQQALSKQANQQTSQSLRLSQLPVHIAECGDSLTGQ